MAVFLNRAFRAVTKVKRGCQIGPDPQKERRLGHRPRASTCVDTGRSRPIRRPRREASGRRGSWTPLLWTSRLQSNEKEMSADRAPAGETAISARASACRDEGDEAGDVESQVNAGRSTPRRCKEKGPFLSPELAESPRAHASDTHTPSRARAASDANQTRDKLS